MKTIILVALVAVAIVSASSIPNEELEIESRSLKSFFHKIKHFFDDFGHKIKNAFSKKNIDKVINVIKKEGVDVIGSIKKALKKSKGKQLEGTIKNLFEHNGKYMGHFVNKLGKEVGHFFSHDVKKGLSKISIFKDGKVQHFFKNVYEKTRHLVKKVLSNKQFDDIIHKLVGMIDSKITEKACLLTVEKVYEAVTEEPTGGKKLDPVAKPICHTALKFLEIGVDHELNIIEKNLDVKHHH